jgi:hypothetical protein
MPQARKRGESTTALCERKRVLECLFSFWCGCRSGVALIFHTSRVSDIVAAAENFRLVLTKKIYLSNIRHVSWGVQWNGRDLTMYRLHALQIRRARDAFTGHALPVCFND